MAYRPAGGEDATEPVVLIVHDEVGASAAEALLNRADCPAGSFFAFRAGQRADTPATFAWSRYDGAGQWRSVNTPDRPDAAHVLRDVLALELDARFDRRVDIFLLTTAPGGDERGDRPPLADTIRRVRQLLDDPGRLCAIVGAPHPDVRDWSTSLDGNPDAAALFQDLLKNHAFDAVFLAEEFRQTGFADTPRDDAGVTVLAMTAAIAVLTFPPLAAQLRQRLDTAQLDLRRRAISISVATLNVDDAAIQMQVRSTLLRRLIEDLLELVDAAEAEPVHDADAEAAQTATQLIEAAGWNVGAFNRLSSRYRERLAAREQEILRDLIQNAGEAARAFANMRVSRKTAPPPEVRRESSILPALAWLFGVAATLAAIGAIFLTFGITDKLAIGGLEVSASATNAAILAILSAGMIAASIVLTLKSRSRSGTENNIPHDHSASDAVPSDKYRALRELQRQLRVEKDATSVWENNIDRSRSSLRTHLDSEIGLKRRSLKVPDAVYLELLSTRGSVASIDEFVRREPHGVKLLAAQDPGTALASLEEYADACVSRIGVFGWPELLRQLAETRDGGLQWLVHMLQQMRRTSGRPTFTPEQGSWEIVALPEATPEALAEAVRAVLPGRDVVLCVTADQFIIVRARIIELPQDPASSSTFSPL